QLRKIELAGNIDDGNWGWILSWSSINIHIGQPHDGPLSQGLHNAANQKAVDGQGSGTVGDVKMDITLNIQGGDCVQERGKAGRVLREGDPPHDESFRREIGEVRKFISSQSDRFFLSLWCAQRHNSIRAEYLYEGSQGNG